MGHRRSRLSPFFFLPYYGGVAMRVPPQIRPNTDSSFPKLVFIAGAMPILNDRDRPFSTYHPGDRRSDHVCGGIWFRLPTKVPDSPV